MAGILAGCKKEAGITAEFSPKYENKEVVLATYGDSTVLASTVISNGKAAFDYTQLSGIDMPLLGQLLIDGRTRGIIVIEPGMARLDSTHSIAGTYLNQRLSVLLAQADSIEALDDEKAYMSFVESTYNANLDNPIGEYFGTELTRNLSSRQIDSLLRNAPDYIKKSSRVARYINAAKLRDATSPGARYTDFSAVQADGSIVSLSRYVGKGKWTLVDFWASWCPYCIKELPELKELQEKYSDKLQIVGVAVRDEIADTQASVKKHGIQWPVIYNAKRIPYDIYGFTGIPHLMLITPEGVIASRGESPRQIARRLSE